LKLRHLLFGAAAVSAGLLVYGALVEANRLVVERRRLRLPRWPKRLDGFKIAVLADLHIRDLPSAELARRAVELTLDESPDFVLLPGDVVGYWKLDSPMLLEHALEPLILMQGNVVASAGNREYWEGDASLLAAILPELNIKVLRNESWNHSEINWVGVDSANAGKHDPERAMSSVRGEDPIIVLWHEPDLVAELPPGASLMVSGHTHGGQFRTPWGWPPMTTESGRKYLEGFFPDAPTPLYVSRGIGTTGPPSRLFCPPEVSILTLESA
jgi:predicted MPP superfamily phosphohydrolase